MTTKESKIIIVGAGVFGLSTSLHLARAGYKDVTVFDYQPYDTSIYDHGKGCDSASSDINKIYRASYGHEVEYQNLAYSGRDTWESWNKTISSTPADKLPHGITPKTKVFVPNGLLRVSDGELSQYDIESLEALEKGGVRHFQHVTTAINSYPYTGQADIQSIPEDMARLKKSDGPQHNWARKLNAFPGIAKGNMVGYLDSSAGFTVADKACVWARHLCEKAGVRFVLGPLNGRLEKLVQDTKTGRVSGIVTADKEVHKADVVVVACGPWVPSLVPETANLLQATAGSVAQIVLPKNRKDLWERYAPANFPTWAYGLTGHESPDYGGFYGFPRNEEGIIKIGYRGRKYTNMTENLAANNRISVPITKHTLGKQRNHLTLPAVTHLKTAINALFPDLRDVGITDTRLCWYTDSVDNSFLIDYVPGTQDSLFVCTGGSGHGFKFLPVLGDRVKNQLEKKKDEFTDIWKWRSGKFIETADINDLVAATEEDWKWVAEHSPNETPLRAKL